MIVAVLILYAALVTLAFAFIIVGGRADTRRNVGDERPDGDCFPFIPTINQPRGD